MFKRVALVIGGGAPVVLLLLLAQAQPTGAAPAPPPQLAAQAQSWCGGCSGTFEGITDPSTGSVYPNGVRFDSGTNGINCPSFGVPAFTLERYDIWTGSSTIVNTSGGSYSGPVCLATFWWPTPTPTPPASTPVATATPVATTTPTPTNTPTPTATPLKVPENVLNLELRLSEVHSWCTGCKEEDFVHWSACSGMGGCTFSRIIVEYRPWPVVCRSFSVPEGIAYWVFPTNQGEGPAALQICGDTRFFPISNAPYALVADAVIWCQGNCQWQKFQALIESDGKPNPRGARFDDPTCNTTFYVKSGVTFDVATATTGGSGAGPTVVNNVCGMSLRWPPLKVFLPITARAPLPTPTPTPTLTPTPSARVVRAPAQPSDTCAGSEAEAEFKIGGAREFWKFDNNVEGRPLMYRGPFTDFRIPWPGLADHPGGRVDGGGYIPHAEAVTVHCLRA